MAFTTATDQANQMYGGYNSNQYATGNNDAAQAGQVFSAIPIVGGIAAGVGSIFQAVNAANQNNTADQLQAAYKRPTRTISPAMQAAMSIYRNIAGQRMMPGQQEAQNQLGANSAQAIRAINQTADSPAAQLAAISGVVNNENNATNNLATQAAQFYNTNQGNYANFLANNVNNEQQQNWQYNQYMPYAAAANAASSLRGAAMQNQNSAVQGLSNVFLNSLKGFTGKTQDTTNKKVDYSSASWLPRNQNGTAYTQPSPQNNVQSMNVGGDSSATGDFSANYGTPAGLGTDFSNNYNW